MRARPPGPRRAPGQCARDSARFRPDRAVVVQRQHEGALRHDLRESVEPPRGRRRVHDAEADGALGATLEEGLGPRLERRVLVDVRQQANAFEAGAAEQARKPATAVRLEIDVRSDSVHDAIRQLAIGMRDRDDPEVLILHADVPTRPRHASHLTHDLQRIGDVQDDRNGERGVEAPRGERQPRAVADAQHDAGAARRLTAESTRPVEKEPTGVDAHHFASSTHERHQVADDDARAAADLEHAITRADRDEPQEAPPQPGLRRRPAARLEAGRHLLEVRLGIGVAPRIGVSARHARTAPAAAAPDRRSLTRSGLAAGVEAGAALPAAKPPLARIRAADGTRLHDVGLAYRILDELVGKRTGRASHPQAHPSQHREQQHDGYGYEQEDRKEPHETQRSGLMDTARRNSLSWVVSSDETVTPFLLPAKKMPVSAPRRRISWTAPRAASAAASETSIVCRSFLRSAST